MPTHKNKVPFDSRSPDAFQSAADPRDQRVVQGKGTGARGAMKSKSI